MKQVQIISDEMARIVEAGLRNLLEQIEEPEDNAVLRKLNRVYDTLSVEDIAGLLAATQGDPDVSKLVAKNEVRLREE